METNKIEVELGEFLFEFTSFDKWCDHAQSYFRGIRPDSFLCIDAKGRICRIGREFMRARDDNSFPVKVYLKTF